MVLNKMSCHLCTGCARIVCADDQSFLGEVRLESAGAILLDPIRRQHGLHLVLRASQGVLVGARAIGKGSRLLPLR